MYSAKLVILLGIGLLLGYGIPSVGIAEDIPAAMPLVVARFVKPYIPGQIELTPRIRVLELDQGRPKVIDLELRRNVYEGESLYVADPFFTCQWPMYSAVRVYNDEGECVRQIEMPPPRRWDGETQGRELYPGQICGRRFGLSYTRGNSNAPVSSAPLKRMRLQLVLFDGIAVGPNPVRAMGRIQAVAKLSGEVVARSELVELGEIPSVTDIYLVDPEHFQPSAHIKLGLSLRLDGPASYTTQSKSAYVDVVMHNDSLALAPLFDPNQCYYGFDSSPFEREVVSLPDNTRMNYSADGLGEFGGHEALRPWEGIIKLPPHTFCGCSQPWLDTRNPGKYRLRVTANDWIVCPLKDGIFTVEWKRSSPTPISASLDYTVE